MVKNVLFFTAPYCAPCQEIFPTALQTTLENGSAFTKIDMSLPEHKNNPAFASIVFLPTIIALDENSTEVGRIEGGASMIEKLKSFFKQAPSSSPTKGSGFLLPIIGIGIFIALWQTKQKKKKKSKK